MGVSRADGRVTTNSDCVNSLPSNGNTFITTQRYESVKVIEQLLCLEKGVDYFVRVDFNRHQGAVDHVYLDSVSKYVFSPTPSLDLQLRPQSPTPSLNPQHRPSTPNPVPKSPTPSLNPQPRPSIPNPVPQSPTPSSIQLNPLTSISHLIVTVVLLNRVFTCSWF